MLGLGFLALGSLLVVAGRAGMRHVTELAGPSLVDELRVHRERVVRHGTRACVGVGSVFIVFAVLQWTAGLIR